MPKIPISHGQSASSGSRESSDRRQIQLRRFGVVDCVLERDVTVEQIVLSADRARAGSRLQSMESLRSRPAAASTVAGLIFAALVFVLGGGCGPVGVGLAALLGVVFAVSMYAVAGARRSRSV